MLLNARSASARVPTFAVATLLLAGVLVACGGGNGQGGNGQGGNGQGTAAATAGPATPGADGAIVVTADNLEFSTDRIGAPAGEAFTIEFTNQEGAPHNIAIYRDESRSEAIFVGEVIGQESITYEIPALEAGDYYFQCDVHPEMNGTLTAGG